MPLADLLLSPTERRKQQQARGLLKQLTRIADALERMSPPLQAPLPDSVTVDDVDLQLQKLAEEVNLDLYQKLGRWPTDEEILARVEEIRR